jgi:hypothetical protein
METDLETPVPPPVTKAPWAQRQRAFVLILVALVFVFSVFITLLMRHQPHKLAMLGMAWGLIFFWIIGCGLAMWHWRTLACQLAAKLPWPWPIKFVIGCILLAMLEEAVTTTMTNCAPLFGVKVGQAYITASTNYFDVILRHSVVIFVPMFVGWAVVLKFWRFSPFEVFLLWGICGTFLEFMYSGFQGLPNFPFWILVYGLMVWLPAHFPNPLRKAKLPRWWAYPLAVILPLLFLPLDLVLAPWLWLAGKHPDIHFPPITG